MKAILLRPLLSLRGGLSACRAYSSLAERLHHELTAKRLPLTYDYLQPQPSHLLNVTLVDLLRQPSQSCAKLTTLPSVQNPLPLPAGHHLVYFPPQVRLSQLLPDGTDTLHSPGEPFNRRLWAGGIVRFPVQDPLLDGSRAVCIESIRNVAVKGREGDEKVIVTIERRVGTVPEAEEPEQSWSRLWKENKDDPGESSVIENRDLIFLREKTESQLQSDQQQFGKNSKIIKPPSDSAFCHRLTPTRALLFRFSALTFNAHSIHLDKGYTQKEEGYRNLLVHGPLTLTLLLTVFQDHLSRMNLRVSSIEYRNLAPLFVEEELAICGKPKNSSGAWDVWIESNGGLSVRGTAHTCDITH